MRRFIMLMTLVALLLPSSASARDPFSRGRVRATVGLGAASGFDESYFLLGGGIGYFVLDGLEVAVDGDAWLGPSPSVARVSPSVRYIVPTAGLRPYGGAFYRHWFVGSNRSDVDTAGGRGGIIWTGGSTTGPVVSFAAGFVGETALSACAGDCSWFYPEFGVAVTF